MRAVYTQGALSDLDEILARLKSVNQFAAAAVENRVRTTVARVERWPRSARAVTQWKGNVRAAPLVRYPYVIFYKIEDDVIEILHIRHTSRAPWEGPTR
ncbi:MAG: type II toxin-antitoxin system RelE/ParE family toxin [Methyloceanibacter sp.]